MRDFTVEKYKQIILSLKEAGYYFINMQEAFNYKDLYTRNDIAIIRHDIDTKYDLSIALEMAKFEADQGIRTTYYFRIIPAVYNESVMKKIQELGHEIGYHYEVLTFAKGDLDKAIELFQNDLSKFRKEFSVSTICQHGGAMGHYETTSFKGIFKIGIGLLTGKVKIKYNPSIDLWDHYNFKDYGIIGDAYITLDHNKIKYFSDTGLRWDGDKSRIIDKVTEGEKAKIKARTSNELIGLIKDHNIGSINLLVHPANWHDPFFNWLRWRIIQKFRNLVKRTFKLLSSRS